MAKGKGGKPAPVKAALAKDGKPLSGERPRTGASQAEIKDLEAPRVEHVQSALKLGTWLLHPGCLNATLRSEINQKSNMLRGNLAGLNTQTPL